VRGFLCEFDGIDRPVPPHPDRICDAIRPLPASGERLVFLADNSTERA
jgi:hypothetical protein